MKNRILQSAAAGCPIRRTGPSFPQAKNGVIDVSLLPPDDMEIYVRIHRWSPLAQGDKLVAYLNSTASQPYYVDDTSQAAYDVPIPASEIPDGSYLAWDTVTDKTGNCSSSLSTPITIVNSKSKNLRAPEFPQAVDNVLSYTSVTSNAGTSIRARYGTISEGDLVTFHWKGFNAEGYAVPSATYTSDPLPVQTQNMQDGYLDGFIPASHILALGDLGKGIAYYEVRPAVSGEIRSSLSTRALISWSDLKKIAATTTDGAPVPHEDLAHWNPCNYATVFGSPGTPITASVTEGGGIIEAGGKTLYHATLDQDGLTQFRVSSENSQVSIIIYPDAIPGDPVVANMQFYPELIDGGNVIQGYNYTTHVPSDNHTPCSIYVLVDPELKADSLTVTVTGDAQIDGFFNPSGSIPLNSDGTATIRIFDAIAENVQVALSVPEHSEDPPVKFNIDFVQFPTAP